MIQIDKNSCIGCKACIKDCPAGAIRLEEGKAVWKKECIQCGHCVAVCPVKAVSIPEYDMEEVEEYDRDTFTLDPDIFLHAVKFRRSIRDYEDQPVEREKMERVDFCLQRVRLENANHLYPAELSGGMIKRVAIARAIVMNPRYLFCDEPNSGLDPQTSIVIDNLIHEITQEYGITTIVNTHDMNSVMEIGEKIVYIHEGRKWWEGTKEEILHADNPELNDFVFASAMAKRAKAVSR